MSQTIKFLFLFGIFGSLIFPLPLSAAGYYGAEWNTRKGTAIYLGLVPCGGKNCLFEGLDPAKEEDEKIIKKNVEEIEKLIQEKKTFREACQTVGGTWWPADENKILSCQFCHFFVMFKGIIDFVLMLVMVIAVLMFVIGGFLFLTAGVNPDQLTQARNILTTTVQGLVIIFAAWIIVNTIFIFIGVADWTNLKEGWFSINCPIKL